jgi:hypothetical protein
MLSGQVTLHDEADRIDDSDVDSDGDVRGSNKNTKSGTKTKKSRFTASKSSHNDKKAPKRNRNHTPSQKAVTLEGKEKPARNKKTETRKGKGDAEPKVQDRVEVLDPPQQTQISERVSAEEGMGVVPRQDHAVSRSLCAIAYEL